MKKINHPEYIFLIVGLILVMGAPYLPDVFFDIIQQDTLYADRYFAARIDELIPSLRLGGVDPEKSEEELPYAGILLKKTEDLTAVKNAKNRVKNGYRW